MQSASFSEPLVHDDGEIVAGLLEDAHAARSDGEDRPHRVHAGPGLRVAVDTVEQLQGLRCYEDAMRPCGVMLVDVLGAGPLAPCRAGACQP